MDFIQIFTDVIKTPDKFWESVKSDKGLMKPWLYYMVAVVLYSVINYLVSIPRTVQMAGTDLGFGALTVALALIIGVLSSIFFVALSAGLVFVSAGILHLFLMVVGARNFEQTFKIICYVFTYSLFLVPFGLLLLIPITGVWLYLIIAIAIVIYTIYMEVKAAKILHELSTGRAVVGIVVLPMIFVLIIAIIMVIMIVGFVSLVSTADITGLVTGLI